jgi:hypothetical protein
MSDKVFWKINRCSDKVMRKINKYKVRRKFFAERETHDEPSDVYTEIHKAKVRSAVTKLCGKLTSTGE